jgi:hypothetical protein
MPRTVQALLDEARGHLNDRESPVRYSDDDLLTYYNDALQEIRQKRPDAFFLSLLTPLVEASDPTTNVPVDSMFYPAIVYYITATAELRDDEFAVDGRVAGLLKQFVGKLMTAGAA